MKGVFEMNIGEKLFELRREKNLSQEEVADKLNVSRQTVSKWETNQSVPDFDKIMPLCELYGVGVEELLTGKKPEEKTEMTQEEEDVPTRNEVRKKSAEVVSTSVFLYIFSIVIVIIGIPVLNWDPILVSSVFLLIIGFATARIIKHYMSIPKFEETKEEHKQNQIMKEINGVIGMICTVLYFVISFTTMAWHVTWVIFIIDGLLCQVVKLFFMLKEEKIDEQ